MKKLLFVIVPAACVFAGVAALLWFDRGSARPPEQSLVPPGADPYPCPIEVSPALLKALGPSYRPDLWYVSISSGNGEIPPPTVVVSRSTSMVPGPQTPASCELRILGAPEHPAKGIDWRIGNVGDPAQLRGKKLTYILQLRADQPVELTTGQIYLYDGKKVVDAVYVSRENPLRITTAWKAYSVTYTMPTDAPAFEVWFRLVLGDGTIQPANSTVNFVATLSAAGF